MLKQMMPSAFKQPQMGSCHNKSLMSAVIWEGLQEIWKADGKDLYFVWNPIPLTVQ